MKSMMCVCAMIMILFSSCSNNEEDMIGSKTVTSEQAVARFKSYFYKNGAINANKLENHLKMEWAVATDDSGRACEVFTRITGVEAPLKEKYEYSYVSLDGKCSIRIVGNSRADEKAVYAIFYVEIQECGDFGKIYIATREYFKGTNEDCYDASIAVPVILNR